MIKFDKPQNLNGVELLQELQSVSIKVNDVPLVDVNGDLWLDIAEKDVTKAESIVSAHNGTIMAPDKNASKAVAQAKLEALGLTADDLKALGL